MRGVVWLMAGLVAGSLAGCAAYHARALPGEPDTHAKLPMLQVKVESLHLPGLTPHPFDARHGLDMTDVTILAVLNNPALNTLRAQEHAAASQAFAAGLLPGPQLSYSRDRPTSNTAGLVNGRSVGLAWGLNTLVASHFEKNAARATAQAADLNVLWAEWQTAQQARVLFIQVRQDERKLALLTQLRQIMDSRYRNLQNAVDGGDVAYDTLGLELAAMQDVDTRTNTLAREAGDARFALNQLLGLAPDVRLDLVANTDPPPVPSDAGINTALKALSQRRPDLIALQYAYRSADEDVRRAVLAQFPGINLGINRANDTSNIHSNGFSIGINFPFLMGGPASVHAAEAGRGAVWQEYQQRLDEAVSDVHTAAADFRLVHAQLEKVRAGLPRAQDASNTAHDAYMRGDLVATDYYTLAITALNRQLQALDLQAQQQQLRIALCTLLGLPPADLEHPEFEDPAK